MPRRLLLILLSSVLLSSLACQAVLGVFTPTPGPTHISTATIQLPSATSSPTFELPTSTIVPPSPTPTWTAEPTRIPVTASPQQLSIFEKLWQIINNEYIYKDFNGLDWNAIHVEYRQKIESGLNPDEFYATLDEMIYLLGDDHSFFLSPEQVAEQEAEYAGENDYVGIGIYSTAVPERKRVTIVAVFPDSPAEKAGLKSHDNILAVDGEPILDENGIRSQLLRGPEGTTITLTVQSPGEQPRQVTITRQRILGALPVPYSLLTTMQGKKIAYLLIFSFADDTVDKQVGTALKALSKQAHLNGIILDDRQNTGGADIVTRNTLSYFTSGNVGYFFNRKGEKRWFQVPKVDVNGSSNLPLVVLIGKNTISFGEIFAGVLQDSGRATLVGETTEGNVELLMRFDFVDGSRAWIAHDAFRPKTHPDQNWEQSGIIPDIAVSSNWDESSLDNDPVVLAALNYLDQN
jgi:carboxyl-terminal processing protease